MQEDDMSNESRILDLEAQIEGVKYSAIIDQQMQEILLELPGGVRLDSVKLFFKDETLIDSDGYQISIVNLNSPVLLSYKSVGSVKIRDYVISIFSPNLLSAPGSPEAMTEWTFCNSCGVEEVQGDYAFYNVGVPDEDASITQQFDLPVNYQKGYILFIGKLWTDSVSTEGITGRPYLWAQQLGELNGEWPVMQGMHHELKSGDWQKVRGLHTLLSGVEKIAFEISQSSGVGVPYFGSKNLFKDVEARVFTSPRAGAIYADQLFQ